MSAEAHFASIALDRLTPNAYNARRFVENMTPQRQARFDELVSSVRQKGIIEPLLVRPLGKEKFEVIAGERRYRAAMRVCELNQVEQGEFSAPCMVREVGDDEAFDLMVIENLQREDLTPLETAQAFQAYLERHGKTADAVAEISCRTGIPTHAIRRQVRLLELPPEILSAWKAGSITQSHAEAFTRIPDSATILELLSHCLRSKLTVRELQERIGAVSPELERAFFDKTECQTCHFNSAVQSGLFPDATPGGKCSNPGCFEAKQSAFLSENWPQSKAAEKFRTRGFRFGHRLGNEHREPITMETADRCLSCDMFVSVLRLTGAVVSMYERTCIGPVKCFEELYRSPVQKLPSPEPDKGQQSQPVTKEVGEKSSEKEKIAQPETKTAQPSSTSPKQQSAAASSPKISAPAEETGPVYNGPRGEKFREEFLKSSIKQMDIFADDPRIPALALAALVTASTAGRTALETHLGNTVKVPTQDLVKTILEDMLAAEISEGLEVAARAHLLEGMTVLAPVRRVVAESLGIKLENQWSLSKEYLETLTKSEIIRIGEEPGVKIWTDERVEAYRKEHHKGKALVSLKKEDLVDIILKSGAELAGRVPAEVLGVRKG